MSKSPVSITTQRYEKLKGQVRDWWNDRHKVGAALREIRDELLYKAEHNTFEDFVKAEFGFTRPHAYRLMDYAEVKEALAGDIGEVSNSILSPVGDNLDKVQNVSNERQARALKAIPASDRAEVLREVAESAPVTAKAITEIIEKAAKAKPVPATIVNLDKMGYPIPDEIWEDWQRAEEFKSTLRELQQIKLDVAQGLKDGDYILYAEVNNGALATLQNSYRDLETILPYAVCTSCQGHQRDNCLLCRRRGFLSKFKYNTVVPENLRKIREALCKH